MGSDVEQIMAAKKDQGDEDDDEGDGEGGEDEDA